MKWKTVVDNEFLASSVAAAPAASLAALNDRSGVSRTKRRSVAHRGSSCRFANCSFRGTADTCVSTVLTEMNNCFATSRYV